MNEKKIKIKLLCNNKDEKIINIINTLLHSDCDFKTVNYAGNNIPMMWIDDHCYTGYEQIYNVAQELKDKERLVYEKTLADF